MIRKIITDSSCDLNKELLENENIDRAPFILELGDKTFTDEPSLDTKKYLDEMENFKGVPITAAPSPEYYYNTFKEADEAFAVSVSAKLSGSYNSAISAKNMILDEFSDKSIHVFDSQCASAGVTLTVIKLNELVEQGLDFDTIISEMTKFIEQRKTFFIIRSYDNLVKTGRVNPYIAGLAKLLSITVIGTEIDGEIELFDKVRGSKKAFTKLVNIVTNSDINFSERTLSISHVNDLESALEFKKLVSEKVNFKNIVIQETSGLCSNYTQRAGIVVSF